MTWLIAASVAALGIGVYIGLGHPGLPGKEDRVLPSGMSRRRRRQVQVLDWLRPRRR